MLDPADREPALAMVAQAVEAHADFDLTFRIHRASDGRVVWVQSRGKAVYDERGRPVGLMGVVADVTLHRQKEEEEKLRLREIEHRAKNLFMVIQSLLRSVPYVDRERFIEAISLRIEALARAHDVIIHSDGEGVPLDRLIDRELSGYCEPGRCMSKGSQVYLTQTAAQAAGMLLHELTTNSVKYGALGCPEGELRIAWRLARVGPLKLTWKEHHLAASRNGGEPQEGRGFGTILMERLAAEMGGAFTRKIDHDRMNAEFTMGPESIRRHGRRPPRGRQGFAEDEGDRLTPAVAPPVAATSRPGREL
jgi:two-component sensor histidine kinase